MISCVNFLSSNYFTVYEMIGKKNKQNNIWMDENNRINCMNNVNKGKYETVNTIK